MNWQRGFSLLELMIAATVLAVALLGTGLLAVRALQDAASLRDHALAALLIDDLDARMELLGPGQLVSGAEDRGIAGAELREWREIATSLLPGVTSELCRDSSAPDLTPAPAFCDGVGPLVVQLTWQRRGPQGPEGRREVLQP